MEELKNIQASAESGEIAFWAYRDEAHDDGAMDDVGTRETITRLITSLGHLADVYELDYEKCVNDALCVFNNERRNK